MSDTPSHTAMFEAFVKSVQYAVGVTTESDLGEALGTFITSHLGAEWTAFVERDSADAYRVRHSTLEAGQAEALLLTEEPLALIEDVLDSGFLATMALNSAMPRTAVLLPVSEGSRTTKVMVVGHGSAELIARETLDVYLAIASLASTTFDRLNQERELAGYRAHLEDLVLERTAELASANEQLRTEIAERTAAQVALYAERERLSVTLRSIGDGVIATDTEARVVLLNGIAEEMTGWTLGEAAGRPISEIFDIINERTGQRALIPVETALRTGKVVELENHTVLTAKDGRQLAIADSCAPIRSADDSIIGAVLVFRDVTEKHRAELLRDALNDINATVSATLSVEEILTAAVTRAAEALGCKRALVQVSRDGLWELLPGPGLPQPLAGKHAWTDRAHGREAEIRPCQPVHLVAEHVRHALGDALVDGLGIESIVLAAVSTQRGTAAVVGFANLSNSASLLDTQVDFVRKVAASLSLALENARLFDEKRHIAEVLQEALVSMPPSIPGLVFDHHYRSATRAARVGGDFYDVFQLENGRIGIVMGDVAGKGVSAATVTVLVRNTIKALAHQGHSAGEVMTQANAVIWRETTDEVFVTVFFAILDPRTGAMTYCSGGHPPAVLRRAAGGCELLLTPCPILGAFEYGTFDEASVELMTGETLLLYTDGIIEARAADGEFFGQDRLIEAMRTPTTGPKLAQHIVDEVIAFTSGDLNDDVAILALSRVEDEAPCGA